MQFGTIPLDAAQGTILAHAVRTGEKLFKKGRVLSAGDIAILRQSGIESVVAARLEPNDILEDDAAARLAAKCAGGGVHIAAAFTGRVNLYAEHPGLVLVNAARVKAFNTVDEAITLATLPSHTCVAPRQMLATIKIIPFAVPRSSIELAEELLSEGSLLHVAAFEKRRIALISTTLPGTNPAILDKNRKALDGRINPLGSKITMERRVAHAPTALTNALCEAQLAGCDPILVFGASAITDRRDVVPAAIERAGGKVSHFGMPVDPGNLLLLGTLSGATVVGLPGCARSPKLNGFDFVLWRILAGVGIDAADLAGMGVGGLLKEIPTRPQPRDERPAAARSPKIGALVLAAGLSSRMGSNKLLEDLDGKPLIRHAVEAAIASQADPVIVVTGHAASAVEDALEGLPVLFAHNPDFAAGLSTSLKTGLNGIPADADGALVMLGDMPGVTAALIDRLIAAFDPAEGRAICMATRHGRRGNPVLWARRFFAEIQTLEGDVGARSLIGSYGELVCEIEADDDAPLADIDTPEALATWRNRS